MKKIYAIPLYVLIGLAVLMVGYLGGLTSYFYAHGFYLNYAYGQIDDEFNKQFPNGVDPSIFEYGQDVKPE